jgi:mRNA deadenylase 3'-5' endonuclease subunit Ccr4
MPFTNYTFDFRGMIDYVFYDTKSLQPLGVLGPVSDEWMEENKVLGCPHPHLHSGLYNEHLYTGQPDTLNICKPDKSGIQMVQFQLGPGI